MEVLSRKRGICLIFVCCLMYAVAYIGRLLYGANLTAIAQTFSSATKSQLGLVSSFFFFGYGGGQFVNFFLAKYYKPKYVISAVLLISAACNLAVSLLGRIDIIGYVWLINGLAQSMIWCNLCNVQAKYMPSNMMSLCVMWNGMSIAMGRGAAYGMSAALISFNWKLTFYIGSALLAAVAVIWFISIHTVERCEKVVEEEPPAPIGVAPQKKAFNRYFYGMFVFAALAAVCNAFIRDGGVTWIPTVLKATFEIKESFAVFITMGLALMSVPGIFLAKKLAEKIKGHLFLESLGFAVMTLGLLGCVLALEYGQSVLFVVVAAVALIATYGNNNITTGQIPFGIRRYGNVGGVAALLDGFCYVGSAVATYTFGLVAEASGWTAVFLMMTLASLGIGIITLLGSFLVRRDPLTKELL